MSDKNGALIMAILAAFDKIDLDRVWGNEAVPNPLKYKVDASTLNGFFEPAAESMPSTFALKDFFADSRAPENMILKEEIRELIEGAQRELEEFSARFESEFGEPVEFTPDFDLSEAGIEQQSQGEPKDESLLKQEDLTSFDSSFNEITSPELGMTEDGKVSVDSGFLDSLVPDTVIDPRNEGVYTSENPVVEQLFDDVARPLHDSVPQSINSKGTDVYNAVIKPEDMQG